MMRRTLMLAAVGCAALLSIAPTASAQVTPAVERTTARARAMLDGGEGTAARTLLDSLVGAVPVGTLDLAEALYWRAVLAERVGEAERDWKRLVIDVPLSPRAPDALVRLGELDMLRGHPADARVYFTRLLRDFPSGAYRAKGLLWLTRSYFEERNMADGCGALDSLRGEQIPDGELRLQSDELQRRCIGGRLNIPASSAPAASKSAEKAVQKPTERPPEAPAEKPAAGAGRYSVQLAAYDTRAEASDAVKRFAKRDIDARIDGEQKPFRVRTGYYVMRADAINALNKLKKLGFDGFVAERAP
ncbi:tetratricopeptide repeat protein [Gemmatimonas groenlandica]|uniref:Tetratricopeptide repeat protein n=2 Tax=Gemmatimonas groenlandica TaxID=2732249 RepID=A0A6M4IRX3_9BACT|nr:tetratricopeptide repeat protein [Gemmatimonas groenlandica]